MRCPKCKNKLIQTTGDITRVRIDGPLEFLADGTARAKCYWCKQVIDLPLQLKAGLDIPSERFLILDKVSQS
jgi:hypothetical protein